MQITRTLASVAVASLALAPSGVFAAPGTPQGPPAPQSISPNHITGQPDQSCEDLANQPGNAINAPGGAFNPDGTAGSVYAGNRDTINNKNTASVSQYDVACEMNQSHQPG